MSTDESAAEIAKAKAAVAVKIQEGLNRLGPSAGMAATYQIRRRSGLTPEDFPDHPEEFVQALQGIFAQGSVVVVKLIVGQVTTLRFESAAGQKSTGDFLRALESASASPPRR